TDDAFQRNRDKDHKESERMLGVKPEVPMDMPRPAGEAGAPAPAGRPGPSGGAAGFGPPATKERAGGGRRDGKTMSDEESKKRQEGKDAAPGELPPDGDRFFGEDRAKKPARQLYRRLDPTMEWAEDNY